MDGCSSAENSGKSSGLCENSTQQQPFEKTIPPAQKRFCIDEDSSDSDDNPFFNNFMKNRKANEAKKNEQKTNKKESEVFEFQKSEDEVGKPERNSPEDLSLIKKKSKNSAFVKMNPEAWQKLNLLKEGFPKLISNGTEVETAISSLHINESFPSADSAHFTEMQE